MGKIVFSRQLTRKEMEQLLNMQEFVRQAHAESDSHDYSHVFTVCRHAIDIAKNTGFKLDVSRAKQEPNPTPEELDVFRIDVDPLGLILK